MSPAVSLDDLPVTDTDVLVVGAGPTGLMAALVLARRGVPAILVDRKAGPTRESRALAVQARTMEIYDQLGLADTVLAKANSALRIQVGGSPRGVGPNLSGFQTGATPFPGVQIFEQSHNEEMLGGALAATGGDVRWGHRLVDLQDRSAAPDGRVEALLEGPDGALLRVRARWCIGADGAASAVRRELNLPFEGRTDDATFWVADTREVRGVPDDAVNIRFGERTFVAVFPLGPGGHVRLVGLAASDAFTQHEALSAFVTEFGLPHGPVDWFSTYRVHHRVSSKFRVGSIFLAGDAAHVHSPVGGQGMNTGLQDAHNVALLLADVAQHRLDGRALDRYERERRPVALTLVNVTDRAFTVIGRRGPSAALLRKTLGALAFGVFPVVSRTPLGARLGGYIGQYRIRYHFPGAEALWARDPVVGLRLPPVSANHEALDTMTWQWHTYGAGRVIRPEGPAWIDGPRDFGADTQGVLRPDRLYLVRPDQFVAASIPLRGNTADAAAVAEALTAHHVPHR